MYFSLMLLCFFFFFVYLVCNCRQRRAWLTLPNGIHVSRIFASFTSNSRLVTELGQKLDQYSIPYRVDGIDGGAVHTVLSLASGLKSVWGAHNDDNQRKSMIIAAMETGPVLA